MIKLMVDSSADCSDETSLFDYFVPLTVSIGGRDYQDGIDLDRDTFYALLTQTGEFPKTSQPSPDDFLQYFEQAKENGDQILYFCLSSALSGTYQTACIAKDMAQYDGIYMIDSLGATHMIRCLAEYARKLVGEGFSAPEIVKKCEILKSKVKILAGLDTLEYLYKGGRLSRARAAVGELAGIKPIITITEEGKVSACSKAIGVNRAIQAIAAKLDSYTLDPDFPVYTLYTCGTENVEKLEQRLSGCCAIAGRKQVGPAIGAHIGPNAYGILFVIQ